MSALEVYRAGRTKLDYEIESWDHDFMNNWTRVEGHHSFRKKISWRHVETRQFVNIVYDERMQEYPQVFARIVDVNYLTLDVIHKKMTIYDRALNPNVIDLEFVHEGPGNSWLIKTKPQYWIDVMEWMLEDIVIAIGRSVD